MMPRFSARAPLRRFLSWGWVAPAAHWLTASTPSTSAYNAVERDPRRLSEAIADGYSAVFGDMADPRIWGSITAPGRKINAFTAVTLEMARDLMPLGLRLYPDLLRFAVAADELEAAQFEELGIRAVLDGGGPPGLALTAAVLGELGIAEAALEDWARRQRHRIVRGSGEAFVAV